VIPHPGRTCLALLFFPEKIGNEVVGASERRLGYGLTFGGQVMTIADYLATLKIEHVIFHDVPSNKKGSTDNQPTFSDVETPLDSERKTLLKKKLTQVVGSRSAFPVRFNPDSASPIPDTVRPLTLSAPAPAALLLASQKMAKYLFEQHIGSVSPGLLCVISVVASSRKGIVLMKLERERGAELQLKEKDGLKTYAMDVLDNLVLTDGTRLFKTAMFLRTGKGDDEFLAMACDSQIPGITSSDLAKFWLRFLGCELLEEPRITTQRFFESAVRFVSTRVDDPVLKAEIYEHIHSQLRAPKKTLSPRGFIEEYVPKKLQSQFEQHLEEENVSLSTFHKDLADIQNRLKRVSYETNKGAIITVPEAHSDLVDVRDEDVLVKDAVRKIR
jgi:hypothetical protein